MQRPFGAYRGEGPYVFVSYAHDDADAVFPELVWLKEQGFNIWYDEGIEAGTEWREELARAIRAARVFVYFVTPQSTASENCKKEVHYAVDRQVPVIAVHLQPTELPDGIDLAISDRQAIMQHEIGESASRVKLVERVSAYVGDVRPTQSQNTGPRATRRWIPAMAVILAVGLGILWYYPMGGGDASDPIEDLSLAVLPFQALSEDSSVGYFADGLRDDVSVELKVLDYCGLNDCNPIHLASGVASDRFESQQTGPAKIARSLGVAYLLEGSVQQRADQARITIELTRGRDGTQVWSKTYERTLDAGFDVQRSLATKIAHLAANKMGFDVDAAQAEDLPRFAGVNPDALRHFMDSANEWRKVQLDGTGSIPLRMQMLDRAIQVDPEFELAHLLLGGMYAFRFGLPLAEAQHRAHHHIGKAQNLEFSEVALEKGTIHTMLDLDYAAAEKLFEQSLSGTPRWEAWQHYWRARIAIREGRLADGLRYLGSARSFQAGFEQGTFIAQTALLYVFAREYERALELTANGLDLDEGGLGRSGTLMARVGAMYFLERKDDAKPIVEELEKLNPPHIMAALYAWLGEEDRARAILAERDINGASPVELHFAALAYVQLGDTDAAFGALELGIKDHAPLIIDSLRLSEFWEPLHDDPRFDKLLDLLASLETHTPAYLNTNDRR